MTELIYPGDGQDGVLPEPSALNFRHAESAPRTAVNWPATPGAKKIVFGPWLGSATKPTSHSYHSGMPIEWHGEMPAKPNRLRVVAIKSVLDLALASVGLIVISPVMLAIAAAVKLTSHGPVFFRQDRVGQSGKIFRIFKFRTMFVDQCDKSGTRQTVPGDNRVTGLGKFLREWSLDELPQLFNVIRGEMSLVGPRPHVPDMIAAGEKYDSIVPYYSQRLLVKPGITGWAQANRYRGPTTNRESSLARIDHDIAYVQNLSLWLDVRILAKTILQEFSDHSGL